MEKDTKQKVHKKITQELYNELRKARYEGMTHREICRKFDVSPWTCRTYLRDIEQDRSVITQRWMEAEDEAAALLKSKGFNDLVNLNQISNNPYWDYYGKLGKDKWLVDVTIDGRKSPSDKFRHMAEGYRSAILHKEPDGSWKLIEIKMREIA